MKANQNFRRDDEAVSPVIGVILMVAITVVLAAVVFVLVNNLGEGADSAPRIGFSKSGAGNSTILNVVSAELADWEDFTHTTSVTGCVPNPIPGSLTGRITAGDRVGFTATGAGCVGAVYTLVHTASNSIAYQTTL